MKIVFWGSLKSEETVTFQIRSLKLEVPINKNRRNMPRSGHSTPRLADDPIHQVFDVYRGKNVSGAWSLLSVHANCPIHRTFNSPYYYSVIIFWSCQFSTKSDNRKVETPLCNERPFCGVKKKERYIFERLLEGCRLRDFKKYIDRSNF